METPVEPSADTATPKAVDSNPVINKDVVFGNRYEQFKQSVKEFMTHLRDVGIGKESLIAHGYDYALSLMHDRGKGGLMESEHKMLAAELLKTAAKELEKDVHA